MVSYTNHFLIKGLSYWNGVVSWFGRIRRRWDSVWSSFDSEAGSWLLFPLSLFPICYRDAYGICTAEWKYTPSTHTLRWIGAQNEKEELGVYRMGWLSAQTRGTKDTKDMDAFLSDVQIETNGTSPPLMVLFQAWSLYDRRWWSAEQDVRIEWIDAVAEEHSAAPMDTVAVPLVRLASKKKN